MPCDRRTRRNASPDRSLRCRARPYARARHLRPGRNNGPRRKLPARAESRSRVCRRGGLSCRKSIRLPKFGTYRPRGPDRSCAPRTLSDHHSEGRSGGGISRRPSARTASPDPGPGYSRPVIVPAEADLHKAADVLNAGKRVAILIGAGAAEAADEVVAVADKLGAGSPRRCLESRCSLTIFPSLLAPSACSAHAQART